MVFEVIYSKQKVISGEAEAIFLMFLGNTEKYLTLRLRPRFDFVLVPEKLFVYNISQIHMKKELN